MRSDMSLPDKTSVLKRPPSLQRWFLWLVPNSPTVGMGNGEPVSIREVHRSHDVASIHKGHVCPIHQSWNPTWQTIHFLNTAEAMQVTVNVLNRFFKNWNKPFKASLSQIRSRVQKFPAWHTKAAPNGKCCEGYIVQSMVRLIYQLKSVLK